MNYVRKIMMSFAVVLVCMLAVPAQKADAAAKLSQTKATVYVGNQTTLKVKGTSKKIVWTTSDKKIATVKKGVVTAKKKGKAVITAKVAGKKYKCYITVKNQELDKKKVTLSAGSTTKLKVNGAYKTVTWKSSNSKVATVSKSGKVTAKAVGTAKITAKHNGVKFTCNVTVKAQSKNIVIKVDKTIINDKDMESITKTYLAKLEIKNKKTEGKYVYYTVTRASYENLMSSIKKSLDQNIAAVIKSQNVIKKITYNKKCTILNLYVDTELTESEDAAEEMLDYLVAIMMDLVYYQAFSGTLEEDMELTFNYYDYATKQLLISESL